MATYIPNTDRGRVRLLSTDTNTDNPILEDNEIDEILSLTRTEDGNDVFEAAAMALETIATNEALVQKKISMLDLSTDGVSLAKELMARAEKLRDISDRQSGFEIASFNHNIWTHKDLLIKHFLENA